MEEEKKDISKQMPSEDNEENKQAVATADVRGPP